MYNIKDAFRKVKSDMDFLFYEIQELKKSIEGLKTDLKSSQLTPTHFPTQIPTSSTLSEPTPTHERKEEAPDSPNLPISTGNEGAPTNQQTNQQTNQHPLISSGDDKISHLQRVSEILSSLDSLKKELRAKFKRLTNQEMVIFSTIYQISDQGIEVDYSLLAEKLRLSEISIRDYTRKIIAKGIPLQKEKRENNKVILKITEDFKRIASLNTIIQLREL